MKGGNHGKIRIECSVDPQIARALMMLRAADEEPRTSWRRVEGAHIKVTRYVAEVMETYVPHLFQKRFGISIFEFERRFPKARTKQLPDIARQLSKSSPAQTTG